MFFKSNRRMLFRVCTVPIYLAIATANASADASETLHRASPDPGVRKTEYVGGTVWEDREDIAEDGVRTTRPINQRGRGRSFDIPSFTSLTPIPSKSGFRACIDFSYCLSDDDQDCYFEQISENKFSRPSVLDEKIPYENVKVIDASSETRRTVTFDGISGGRVQLRYREHTGDVDRVDEEYAIRIPSTPHRVTIRDLSFLVYSVDGDRIQYEIESSLARVSYSDKPSQAKCRAN